MRGVGGVVGLDRQEMMLCLNIFMCLLCLSLEMLGSIVVTWMRGFGKPPHYLNLPEVDEFADVC